MADGFSADFSELYKLAADLDAAAADIQKPLKTALNVTSMKVKKSAQAKVRGRKQLGQAASAITFDVTTRAGEVESEIGYDKSRAVGKLGNLIEFGAPASGNSLSPGNELQTSLHEEEADFIRGIEIAIDDALKSKGL
jgi:hypothetical protein